MENKNFESEIWKEIPGYEGDYLVSDLGRVKSLKRLTPIFLKPRKQHNGYETVVLYKNKFEYRDFFIHRLVMWAFVGENKSKVVDHINNNRSDNRLCNLRYLSQRKNCSSPGTGSSKYVGVQKAYKGKWRSAIRIQGKKYQLGTYEEEIDAHKSYMNALDNWNKFSINPEGNFIKKVDRTFTGQGKISNYTSVINTKTGEKFKSITEASKYYKIERSSLSKMLSGISENITDLTYV